MGSRFSQGHEYFVSKESALVWEGQVLSARMPLPLVTFTGDIFPECQVH